jgi:hypothetical protein
MKGTLSMFYVLFLLFSTQNIKAQTPLQVSIGAYQTICYDSYLN